MLKAHLEADGFELLVRMPYHPTIKDRLKELPTARWSKPRKAWTYDLNPSVATKLRELFTEHKIEVYGPGVDALDEQVIDLPKLDSLITTDSPAPWPHQIDAAHRIAEFASYVHGGMGVGKTRSVVDAVVSYKMRRVLVLCPSSVVAVWPKEFAKYAAGPVTVVALDKRRTIAKRTDKVKTIVAADDVKKNQSTIVVAINYEAAWRDPFKSWAMDQKWDLVVFDEAHRIKAPKGKQSLFCGDLRNVSKRACGMSGTPMPHGPLDVFGQFRALDPAIYGTSETRFRIKYGSDVAFTMADSDMPPAAKFNAAMSNSEKFAATYRGQRTDLDEAKAFAFDLSLALQAMAFGWTDQEVVSLLIHRRRSVRKEPAMTRGHYIAVLTQAKKMKGYPVAEYSNLEDLRARMDKITIRISRDVLDLPDAISTTRYVELTKKEQRVHDDLMNDLVAEIEAGKVTARNALVKLIKLQQAVCGFVRTDQGDFVDIGKSRRDTLTEILEDAGVQTGEPIVVFTRFRRDLDAVHESAAKLEVGSFELSGRKNELAEWQQDGAPPVLAVQIQAGGIGVDLTRSRYSVFYSLGYSLGDYEQALARVHRPGQEKKVTHIHVVSPGTVDERVYEALERKRDVVEFVIETLGARIAAEG